MKILSRFVFLIFVLSFASCKPDGEIRLGSTETLEIVRLTGNGQPVVWKLNPNRQEHKRLMKWIEENQDGWSPYRVTTPAIGLLVNTKDWRLQFFNNTVLACRRAKGCWEKSVKENDYEYLLQSHGQ